MAAAKVLILYNEPVLPESHPDADSEHEILSTVDGVSKTLLQAGFDVSRLGLGRDPSGLVSGVRSQRPDVVFNLFEGTADQGKTEAVVAGMLEWLGLPFTGSPSHTLCLARNKHLTKYLLQGAGLPTPQFFVVDELPVPDCPLEWPVIVKPAMEDASVGLDQGSVVTEQAALQERVKLLMDKFGPPVLVEQFVRGREFNIGIVENPNLKVLPISEILFVDKTPGYWPIVTYDAKWKPGTHDYEATPPRYPAEVAPKLADRLESLASQAYRLLGCRDYARVDFRIRPPGKPYILEVNPNPDFSPVAGLSGGLMSAGLTHAQFTVDLVHAALKRGKAARNHESLRTTGKITCRRLQSADREKVRELLAACEGEGFRPDEITHAHMQFDAALAKASAGKYHAWTIENDKNNVGFVCISKMALSAGSYQVHGLVLQPAARGKGLGRRLMQAAAAGVVADGGTALVVETSTQPCSIPARQFFSRNGFHLAGDIPDFYREGDGKLTYVKYLSPAVKAESA